MLKIVLWSVLGVLGAIFLLNTYLLVISHGLIYQIINPRERKLLLDRPHPDLSFIVRLFFVTLVILVMIIIILFILF